MLVYDGFPNVGSAKDFADAVTDRFGLVASVYVRREDTEDEYPFEIVGPFVLVQRIYPIFEKGNIRRERAVEKMAEEFGGAYKGS